jgi:ankyrin repeat protein
VAERAFLPLSGFATGLPAATALLSPSEEHLLVLAADGAAAIYFLFPPHAETDPTPIATFSNVCHAAASTVDGQDAFWLGQTHDIRVVAAATGEDLFPLSPSQDVASLASLPNDLPAFRVRQVLPIAEDTFWAFLSPPEPIDAPFPSLPAERAVVYAVAGAGAAPLAAFEWPLSGIQTVVPCQPLASLRPSQAPPVPFIAALHTTGIVSFWGPRGESLAHVYARGGPDLWPRLSTLLRQAAACDALSLSGRTPLIAAAAAGSRGAVLELVSLGANVAAVDATGLSAVAAALQQDHEDIAKDLLAAGADIDQPLDPQGAALIHHAAASGNAAELRRLLSLGASPVAVDNRGRNALHIAASAGSLAALDVLLAGNAVITARDSLGDTPLHSACAAGCEEAVRRLLDTGIKPDPENKVSRTPLHHAVAARSIGAVSALLEAHCDVDAADDSWTRPLHLAAAQGAPDLVSLLTAAGAPVTSPDRAGRTALHLAVAAANVATVAVLLRVPGIEVNVPDENATTPLHAAALQTARLAPKSRERCAVGEIIRLLMESDAAVTALDRQGRTPLDLCGTDADRLHILEEIVRPPTWVPDETNDACTRCKATFSFHRRRHHCRHCSSLVCADCSAKRCPIPKFGLHQPVRVCNLCYSALSAEAEIQDAAAVVAPEL